MPWAIGATAFLLVTVLVHLIGSSLVCRDGWSSSSIGHQGACSHHGGVDDRKTGLGILLALAAGVGGYAAGKHIQKAGGLKAAARDARQRYHDRPYRVSDRCPTCQAEMVSTVQRSGPNAGKRFLICSNFPECRGFKDL
jgi:hypothetical protein